MDKAGRKRRLDVDGLAKLTVVAKRNGGAVVSRIYAGAHKPHLFRCREGHVWESHANTVLRGSWCSLCFHASRRLSIIDAKQAGKERGGKCLSESYTNSGTKLEWVCDKGHQWWASLNTVRKGHWCKQCAHAAQITNPNSPKHRKYEASSRQE